MKRAGGVREEQHMVLAGWGEAVKGFLTSLPLFGRIAVWAIRKMEKRRVEREDAKKNDAAYRLNPDDVGRRLRKRMRR